MNGSGSSAPLVRLRMIQSLNPAVGEYKVVRVDVRGRDGAELLHAKRAAVAGVRGMEFFRDAARTELVARYFLRKEPGRRVYEVEDASGARRCRVVRVSKESRWRSILRLETLGLAATITESSAAAGILRRVSDLGLPAHFEVTEDGTGERVASIRRDVSVRDKRTITLCDPRLGETTAAVLLVLLDSELFL